MTSKHTPAPWRADEWDCVWIGDEDHALLVANCRNSVMADRVSQEQAPANARLIAEAPAMLSELRNIQNGIETRAITSEHDETFATAAHRIRALLARIDGEGA